MSHSALWKAVSYFQLPVRMTLAGKVCLSSSGISNPSQWAAEGGVNSASRLMLIVHSLPLWGVCPKVTPKDIARSLSLLQPALPALVIAPGQQLGAGGVLSRVAVLSALFPGEPFSIPSRFTLQPWLPALPQPHHPAWLEFLAAFAISCWGAQQIWVFSPLCTSVPLLDHRNVYPVFEHSYVFLVH